MREYDLLVGILACQLRLVSRGTLVRYSATFAESPSNSLLDFLFDAKALTEADQQFLCRIVDTIVHAHRGDERAALNAFGGEEAASDAFSGSIIHTERGWGPSEDYTVLAEHLPHGLPAQITPETIGRYTRGSEYARGGIGRILLVHDEQIGRDVILKELLPEHTTSPTASTLSKLPGADSPKSPMRKSASMMARFLQEAKITGQLEHPSIVPVYELGTRTDGQLYYTMKLVRGDTLAIAIKNCKSAQDRLALLRSFLDVCQAMAYAHSKGVIHRDLKPSNIMVGEFGECVVLDWGLAKMQIDPDTHREALEKTISQFQLGDDHMAAMQTRSKDVLGTPLYMSPEQARGEVDGVGFHSDVYSLGVILYEILSGELPHPWSNSLDTIRRVASVPAPSIRLAAPHTPPELAAICDKALAFAATKRYPSAKELATDLQHFLEGAVVGAYAYRFTDLLGRLYRRHKPIILATSAAALLLLVMGTISYINIYRARDAEETARIVAEEQRKLAVIQEQEAKKQAEIAATERDRATTAEERTAQEKYISDIRLADAYVRDYKFQAAEDTLLATEPKYRNIEWGYLVAQCHQELATLSGHTNVVFKSFFSPDGKSIVTVGGDFTARLWNAETYAQIHEWRFTKIWLRHAVFDASGSQLALSLSDGSVHVMDPSSGAELYSLAAHTAPVNFCTFNAAGDRLVTASSDRTVKIWDLSSRSLLRTLENPGGEVKEVGYCNGERSIYTVPDGKPIRLHSLDGRFLAEGPGVGVHAPADGALLAARHGNEVVVYRGRDLSAVVRLPHEDSVERVTFYPELQRLITACADGIARVWRIPEGTLEQVFNVRHPLKDCKLSPDGRLLAAMAVNGLTVVWDRASAQEITRFSGHREATAMMEFDPKGGRILTCSMDGSARIWLASRSPWSHTVARTLPGLTQLSIAREGGLVAVASRAGQCVVQDSKSNATLYTAEFQEQLGGIRISLAPDGRRIVIVPDEFLPLLISLPDGKVIRRLEGHQGYISGINYSPDGKTIITTSWDNTAILWDGVTGAYQGTLAAHTDTLYYAALSPDGGQVATASDDMTTIIWDRATQEPLFTVNHKSRVVYCAFSHNGKLIATASTDGTIQVWNIATKASVHTLAGQMYDLKTVAFSADDRRLLSVSSDNSVRLWDVESGESLIDIPVDSGAPELADFGLTADSLLIALQSGELREVSTVPFDSKQPATDRTTLYEQVLALKEGRWSDATLSPAQRHASRVDRIVPQPQALEGLKALTSLAALPSSDATIKIEGDMEARCWPLGLQTGDTLLKINDSDPAEASTFISSHSVANLEQNGVQFHIDLLRDSEPVRVGVNMLPVAIESRTIALPNAQAQALLREAVKTLGANTEAILQISKRFAEYARIALPEPDSIPGLWVIAPTNLIDKRMLVTSGLAPCQRLATVNGIPIRLLKQVTEMCEIGVERLSDSSGSGSRLEIEQGQFSRIALTYVHQGAP